MSIKRERNDPKSSNSQNRAQKSHGSGKFVPKEGGRHAKHPSPLEQKTHNNQKIKYSEEGFIWGFHAVSAALKNSSRHGPLRLFLTPDRRDSLGNDLQKRSDLHIQILDNGEITRILPQGAVHQGMALNGPPLEGEDLESLMDHSHGVIVMLDQVTDPQNIGAILRSCAAFGVLGLVLQDRHSPVMQGVLAKTAAGAMDMVSFAKVTNLSRALEKLNDQGWVSIGLAGETDLSLQEALTLSGWNKTHYKVVLVLGSEGDGLRRLVAEHCDHLAKIPMPGGFESLNVSHATSIALYEALGRIA